MNSVSDWCKKVLKDSSCNWHAYGPVRTAEIIAVVAQCMHENTRTSTDHRAQQLNVSRTSLRRILDKDLGLFAYKLQHTQEFSLAVFGMVKIQQSPCIYFLLMFSLAVFGMVKIQQSPCIYFLLMDIHKMYRTRIYTRYIQDVPFNLKNRNISKTTHRIKKGGHSEQDSGDNYEKLI
ncbi:hypothetical protein NQ318_013377 [Aromia moschata]|uniref:Transposase n=1 Tax=Aromia moschata TaxID=1265417 RepID=A0AAV8X5R4_9CUCU|nr:hypothetical protein NQ318_013377 [Aromia moschata]